MNEEEKLKLKEMRTHLGNLHQEWQDNDGAQFGHKSNEGYIGVLYRYPNWFEAKDKQEYINIEPKVSLIEVYSYLFGPSRLHSFATIDEAYKEVMTWK